MQKRRFFVTVGLAALTLLVLFGLDRETALVLVRHTGYYFVLAATLAFVVSLAFWVRMHRNWRPDWKELRFGAVAVFIGSWLVFVHGDLGFKIAMDDYLLAATAKGLHETREVAYIDLGLMEGNDFIPQRMETDKRPWFYPFLVASLHDITGYSERNPFLVNAAACVLFFALVYLFGRLLAGRMGGLIAVLLWASVPLLLQNATGAGMEMVNLMMLQAVLLLAALYLWKPSESLESALALAGVLLTYTRYESGLFLLPVALVIILGWWRSGKVFLSWGTVCAAPLLLAVGLQTRIYANTEASWELAEGVASPFGWEHLIQNIPHALAFFLSPDDTLGNSLLIGLLAAPAVLAFLVLLRTELKVYWRSNPAGLVLSVFALFYLANLAIVMSFHAGQLDQRAVSRYALPFHQLVVFATIALLGYAAVKWRSVWRVSLGVVSIFILTFTLPTNSKAIFISASFPVREFAWLEEISEKRFEPRSLIVGKYVVFWSLQEWAALRPQVVAEKPERVERNRLKGTVPTMYLVERVEYREGRFVPQNPAVAGLLTKFDARLLAEKSFYPLTLTRVYELEGLHPAQP